METKMKRCANVGCEMPLRGPSSKFCSTTCHDSAKQQRLDENHIRRIFENAENLASRTEDCRGCPGGFVYSDEEGSHWCMCGRNATSTGFTRAA